MRFKATFAAMIALGAAACSGGQTKAPDSIDRMSKAEVESIVKEYLLREPEILFEMQAAYQRNQLATQTLAAEGAWDKLMASAKDDPFIGRKDAPITIVEFSDYDCGVCKAAVPWVMSQVDDRRSDIKLIVKESAVRGADSPRCDCRARRSQSGQVSRDARRADECAGQRLLARNPGGDRQVGRPRYPALEG